MARRGGEFTRLGSIGIHGAGVRGRRAREIEMARAWGAVAGEALSRRVSIVGLTRGVLALEAADRRWLNAIRPEIPRLARLLARRFPALGIKKLRLRVAGSGPRADATIEVSAIGDLDDDSGETS